MVPSILKAPPATLSADYRRKIERRHSDLQQQLAAILPPAASITWEVGCGHGHFLTAYAEAHPEQLCVGIDLAAERIARALRKRDRARLNNLFFLQAAADLFLDALPADATVSDIFILFPDPWPKSRHHKHRVLQSAFLAAAAPRATPKCRLCFRTDFQPYFADTLKLLANDLHWRLAEEAWPFEFATVFQNRAPSYQSVVARRVFEKNSP